MGEDAGSAGVGEEGKGVQVGASVCGGVGSTAGRVERDAEGSAGTGEVAGIDVRRDERRRALVVRAAAYFAS